MKVGTDMAVPHKHLKRFYYFLKSSVENAGLDFLIFGHAGDSHLHLNILPRDESEYRVAKSIYLDICENAINLGGTISAEHGIGKLKCEYLIKMFGEKNIRNMAKLKMSLDPNNILCKGNIFDEKFLS